MNYFYFNNFNSITDKECFLVGNDELYSANEQIESIDIEGGRIGELIRKKGYKNLTIKRTLQINNENYNKVNEVLEWLKIITDNRLQFKKHKNKCYKVKYVNIESIKNIGGATRIEVAFICYPHIYNFEEREEALNIGENTINIKGIGALPILKFSCSSKTNVTIAVNGQETIIENCEGNITLDTSLMLCNSSTKGNLKVNGDYISLVKGDNTINITSSADGAVSNIKIKRNEVYLF